MNIMNRIAMPPKNEKFRIYPHIERQRAESTNVQAGSEKILSWLMHYEVIKYRGSRAVYRAPQSL